MVRLLSVLYIVLLVVLLQACDDGDYLAPVTDLNQFQSLPRHTKHAMPRRAKPPPAASLTWLWPAEGKVYKKYSDINKGIDIAGRTGAGVYAAATGQVVYSGNGLRGYGRLIIIKHESDYLSAYAYNQSVFVKEGDRVLCGQKIAEMGHSSSGKAILHFEIRQAGKPIDPLLRLNQVAAR